MLDLLKRRSKRRTTRDGFRNHETSHSVLEVPDFQPLRILEVEIGRPLPAVPAFDPQTGRHYTRGRALVRLHTQPLGVVELYFDEDGLTAAEYARQIWHVLGPQIQAHLLQDGLMAAPRLDANGLPSTDAPKCEREREIFLANAPFASVVVPTHNRPKHIEACVRSLLASSYPDFEIIVVDNNPSTEATAELIQQAYGGVSRVRYVREDRPGASWARNRGLLEARAEIVAFVDDDVVVDSHWLAEIVKAFSLADNVACVTGNVLPVELETRAQAWLEQRGGFSRGFTRRIFDMAEHRPKQRLYPYAAMIFGTGANMAFKTAVLRDIGGFDPVLDPAGPAFGGEDFSSYFEVVMRGYQLVFEPAAIVHHLHHREDAALRKQMYGWGVGFVAYLTKCLSENPVRLIEFSAKLPYTLLYFVLDAVRFRRARLTKMTDYYPEDVTKELWNIERRGFLYGPVAYLRARRHARHVSQRFGPLEIRNTAPTVKVS